MCEPLGSFLRECVGENKTHLKDSCRSVEPTVNLKVGSLHEMFRASQQHSIDDVNPYFNISPTKIQQQTEMPTHGKEDLSLTLDIFVKHFKKITREPDTTPMIHRDTTHTVTITTMYTSHGRGYGTLKRHMETFIPVDSVSPLLNYKEESIPEIHNQVDLFIYLCTFKCKEYCG